jgi:hypothetical protein
MAKKQNKTLQHLIFVLATAAVSTMVELMVLDTGGHQSFYYAGMIIVSLFALGFVPLTTLKKSLFLLILSWGGDIKRTA